MKSLILTALLVFSFSSFAAQVHDVNCEALAESTERVNTKAKSSEAKEVSIDSASTVQK